MTYSLLKGGATPRSDQWPFCVMCMCNFFSPNMHVQADGRPIGMSVRLIGVFTMPWISHLSRVYSLSSHYVCWGSLQHTPVTPLRYKVAEMMDGRS